MQQLRTQTELQVYNVLGIIMGKIQMEHMVLLIIMETYIQELILL